MYLWKFNVLLLLLILQKNGAKLVLMSGGRQSEASLHSNVTPIERTLVLSLCDSGFHVSYPDSGICEIVH
jgi:hypothetical protein